MKIKYGLWVLLLNTLLLQGCDSLDETKETLPLVPDAPKEIDPNLPRPSESALVITSSAHSIFDTTKKSILARGVNVEFANNPSERIGSMEAVKEVGSNIVRIQLLADTTPGELDAAINAAASQGLVAMLTLGSQVDACNDDKDYLEALVDDIWLSKWIAILAEDKYQPYIMINIANKWGPVGVFDATAVESYDDYMNAYKVAIRRFRQSGLNVPLVIDAPGCGVDHYAFMGGRANELLSADEQRNLIVSVHAYGSRWSSQTKMKRSITDLQSLPVPFIITEFGGSEIQGDDSLNHLDLMSLALGDKALELDLPWSAMDNQVAYSYPLTDVTDITGSNVYFDVFLSQSYIDEGSLNLQVYFTDVSGNVAKASVIPMSRQIRNQWNKNGLNEDGDSIEGIESFEAVSEGFDITQVEHIGFQFSANGKAVDVDGKIKIDNIILGAAQEAIYTASFDTGKEGWDCKGWQGEWTEDACIDRVSYEDQQLIVNPPWESTGSDGLGIALGFDEVGFLSPGIDLEKGFELSFDVFIPEEYASETGIVIQPFLSDSSWTFKSLAYIQANRIVYGEWNTFSMVANEFDSSFVLDQPLNRIGMQILNITTAKTEGLIVDNIVVSDLPIIQTETIYNAVFSDDEGWGIGGGAGEDEEGALEQVEVDGEGVVALLPTWGDGVNQTQVRYDSASSLPTPIDPSQSLVVSFDIFFPEEYSVESSMYFQIFMNGYGWVGFAGFGYTGVSGLTLNQWNTIIITINDFKNDAGYISDDFNLEFSPVAFGIQIAGVEEVKSQAILIDNFKITMDVGDFTDKILLDLTFENSTEVESFVVDESPDLSQFDWVSAFTGDEKQQGFGVDSFGWIAWSWKGGEELDISNQEASVDLTQRGEEIVNDLSGIGATSIPASFPAGFQPNPPSSSNSSSSSSSTSTSNSSGSSNSTSSSSSTSTSSSSGALIVLNGGLEDGAVTPWIATGSTALAIDTTDVRSANNSLLVSGRTATWNAAGQDVELTVGKTYSFSVWVKMADVDATASFTLKKVDADGEDYITIESASATTTDWLELKGNYIHEANGDVTELFLFVESAEATASYYLDDLVVFEKKSISASLALANGGLEAGGFGPWYARGDATVTLDATEVHAGTNSLLVTDRSATWHGHEYPLTSMIADFVVGQDYMVSVWVKMAGVDEVLTLGYKRVDDDGDTYGSIAASTVTSTGWVELKGVYSHVANGEVTELAVFIESSSVDASYYVDDLTIVGTVLAHTTGLSAGQSKFLGNIIGLTDSLPEVPTDFKTYWNQVSPENSGKWGSVEGTRDVMNWDNLDKSYAYAKANNLPFKLHVLVWGSQEPAWMADLVTAEAWVEIAGEVEEWIAAAAKRYPDTDIIDVVNEPQHQPASYREALGGDGATGWDWIVWSFEKARQYFPNAQLHLNDYGIINDTNAIAIHREIAEILKDRELIDAIAIQAHHFSVNTMTATEITENLDELAKTGLPLYVAELDITGLAVDEVHDAVNAAQEDLQEVRYQEVFPALWEHNAVKGVTLWGYKEGATWVAGSGIFNADGSPRKAMTWLESYFAD